MHLALRSTAATASGFRHRFSTAVIRAVLCTDFPHAGIVIGGVLYHSNAEHGLNKTEFSPEKWVLIDLGSERDSETLALFERLKGTSYDWLELFDFTFVRNAMKQVRKLPWLGPRLQEWMYCYQWCYLAMTGQHPTKRVTCETLLLLASKKLEADVAGIRRDKTY